MTEQQCWQRLYGDDEFAYCHVYLRVRNPYTREEYEKTDTSNSSFIDY